MRLRIAWGAMFALIVLAAPAQAEPNGPRLRPLPAPPAAATVPLPGIDLPDGRFGMGFYAGGQKRPTNMNRDAIQPPGSRKTPGVGLRLSF